MFLSALAILAMCVVAAKVPDALHSIQSAFESAELKSIRRNFAAWEADIGNYAAIRAEKAMEEAAARGYPRTEAAFEMAKELAVCELKKSNPWAAPLRKARYA